MMIMLLQLGWRNFSHLRLSKIAQEISLTWKKLSSARTCLGLCIQVKVSLTCAEVVDFSACFGAQVLQFLDSLNSYITNQNCVLILLALSCMAFKKILLLFLFCCSQKKVVQFFTHNNLFYVNPSGLISLAFLPKKKTICSMFTQAI